jgi:spore cortex formation protein SpoVR/YcgB (stage V sporulation)
MPRTGWRHIKVNSADSITVMCWQELLGGKEVERLVAQAYQDIERMKIERMKPRKVSGRTERRRRQQQRQREREQEWECAPPLRWHDESVQKMRRGIDRGGIVKVKVHAHA